MTWPAAIESLAEHPAALRFRRLCADDWPDVPARDAYRAHVIRLATGEPAPPPYAIAPHPDDRLVMARGLRACLYGAPAGPSCCNALATVCHWKGRLVLACDCLDCLSPSSAPAPTED